MKPDESKLTHDEFQLMYTEAKTTLKLIKESANGIKNGLAYIEDKDIDAINPEISELKNNDPIIILKCLRNLVDGIRLNEIDCNWDYEKLAYHLGHTYGIFASINLNWDMVFLTSNTMPEGEVAVVSKNRNHAMYPTLYFFRLLSDPQKDNASMLTINMAKENQLPETEENYTVILG